MHANFHRDRESALQKGGMVLKNYTLPFGENGQRNSNRKLRHPESTFLAQTLKFVPLRILVLSYCNIE